MKFQVYYSRPEHFGALISGMMPPDLDRLDETHVWLREIEAKSLDDVFYQCQGEIWSPNGEATTLILAKGLRHTSMSVGDVVADSDGRFWACAFIGWTELGCRQ